MTRSPIALLTIVLAACASAPRPADGPPAAPPPAAHPASPAAPAADVRFVRDMLAHHAQALVMTALVPARTSRRDIRLLAERIDVSQHDEIALMQRWLRRHGESDVTSEHAGHEPGHSATPAMPGMLSAAELDALRAAHGAEFDRLFLEGMIRHHEGALAMVATLLASRGGTSDTEIFRLAADIDADQRAEIQRMRALLGR